MRPELLASPAGFRPRGGRWVDMLGPLGYRDPRPRPGLPNGFELWLEPITCDGASIPKAVMWAFRASWQELLAYGCAHDGLYRTDATILPLHRTGGVRYPVPSRRFADAVGADLILVSTRTAPRWDRFVAYTGTRIGGGGSYQKRALDWTPD